MSPERWQQVKTLFHQAVETPAAERGAFLAAACAGDPELHAEVSSLLAADANEPVATPARIGPWMLLGELGRGGMSTVYLAARADDEYRREVALKLIRRGMDGEEARRRFRRERQILARLEHPAIARLYDGGTTPEGLPYLVMERVDGLPLDAFCGHHRLGVRARVALFLEVCAAVHVAHQHLVVHRDLKPSNVLVTPEGTPKLLDFGIARLLDPELDPEHPHQTLPGQTPLTPSYSSPEQVRGEPITTASDVYSLGVMLYELLAGRPPYRLESLRPSAVERVIAETAPAPPSVSARLGAATAERARLLAGDLDAIVLKALEKDPRRRYASAEQLAADLRRHLEHRPIHAVPETRRRRLVKLVRRHRAAVAALALLLVFAAAMTFESLWLARALGRATTERARAERVSRLLVDLFTAADPESAAGGTLSVREVLDLGAGRITAELGEDPLLQAELLSSIGQVYQSLGLFAQAEPALAGALERRRRVLGEHEAKTAASLELLGRLRYAQGEYAAAELLLRRALALHRELLAPADPALASSLHNLAELLHTRGRLAEAETLYREALTLRQQHGAPERELAESLSELAFLRQDQADYEGAERLLREALALHRRLYGEEHALVATDLDYLAWTLQAKGELESAEALYRQTLALRRKLLGPEHPALATTLNSLGLLLYLRGDDTAAEPLLREALAIREHRRGPEHPELGTSLNDLGLVLERRGELAAAETHYRRALAIFRAAFGDDHTAVAIAAGNLGSVLAARGDHAAAEPLLEEALATARRVSPAGHPQIAQALRNLGQLRLDGGRPAAAEPLLRESLEIFERVLPESDPRRADAARRLEECRKALTP